MLKVCATQVLTRGVTRTPPELSITERAGVRVAPVYCAGGISTVSMRYTVALAVRTPPHTTLAPLTCR